MKEETVVCPVIAAGTSSGVIYLLSVSSTVVLPPTSGLCSVILGFNQ